MTQKHNFDSRHRFAVIENSLQHRVFLFLAKNNYATNPCLYSVFGAITREKKKQIKKYKKRFFDKYNVKPDPNQKYSIEDYDKEQSKKIQDIIDLFENHFDK